MFFIKTKKLRTRRSLELLCAELLTLLVASADVPSDHAVELDRIDTAGDGELESLAVAV